MKMCLAPCYKGCTDERYAEESAAVESFLATRGESRLVMLRAQRDQASANLEFESAAALHAQVQRVEAVRSLAAEIVRPLSRLRAVILQASANPDEVAVFLFENGRLRGPAAFSTLGMRIQNEQSGSTSLFAQPWPSSQCRKSREQGQGSGTGAREQGTGNRGTGSKGARERGSGIQRGLLRRSFKGHDFSRANNSQQNEGALAPEDPPRSRKTRQPLHPNFLAASSNPGLKPYSPSSPRLQRALANPPPGPSGVAQALVLPPRSSPRRRNLLPRRRRPLAHQSHPARRGPRGSKDARYCKSDVLRRRWRLTTISPFTSGATASQSLLPYLPGSH